MLRERSLAHTIGGIKLLPEPRWAAKAGFDEIIVDFSALSFEQNVLSTKEALEAVNAINPAILVEGER
jgi:fructose/tagatose bisphosphate aldolase